MNSHSWLAQLRPRDLQLESFAKARTKEAMEARGGPRLLFDPHGESGLIG